MKAQSAENQKLRKDLEQWQGQAIESKTLAETCRQHSETLQSRIKEMEERTLEQHQQIQFLQKQAQTKESPK